MPPLSNRRVYVRALAILAVLAWPGAGFAQGDPAAEPRANPEAQTRYEAGVAAYEEGRYRDAVERFKEADELAPSPRLSFNIAKVYERMGDNRSALASYRTYLRRLPNAENKGVVAERIALLEHTLQASGVQQLTILSLPAGATVAIDDVRRGVTPWTGELIPGPHTLELRLEGYQDAVSEIELPAEHAIDVEAQLLPAPEPPAPAPAPVAAVPSSAPAVPTESAPPTEASRAAPSWLTWAIFGGSAAAFVGAGAFELSRRSLEEEAKTDIQLVHDQKFRAMESRMWTARAFAGVGIATAIVGGVSLYFDLRSVDDAGSVAFDCAPNGCTLAAGGRF